ncbi:uncharacterized protein LOC142328363 [Lycorma delicatula]|uniref:uncharacterized protein LOC142328363 n=1 Tax=Lycorma delicatula TaxID=130591 RepID=UPI003F511188
MDGSTNKDCLMDFDNSNILIDLKSPADKKHYKLPSPLIPCPQIKEPVIYSNPFDIVATEANYCDKNDPFEMVFNSAFCTSKIAFNKPNDNENCKINNGIKIDVQKKSDEICESHATFNNIDVNNKNDKYPSTIKKNLDDKQSAKKVDCNECISFKITDTLPSPCSELKKNCINQLNMESTKSSISSLDLSSEETIRASIAKRIKKCTQRVLNNSMCIDYPVTINKDSQTGKPDQRTRQSLPPQFPQFNVSDTCNFENKKIIPLKLMFSPIISKPIQNISELSPVLNDNKIMHHTSTCWSTGSNDLNKGLLYSASSWKWSGNSETPLSDCPDAELSLTEIEDSVFVEAKKLADTFSEIASNFSQMNLSDEAEDLMSCNPKWEPIDSSDEERDMLRNDPALNLKFSSGNLQPWPSPKKFVEFSDAVIQYKKRRSFELNSSLDQNSSDQQEVAQLKRSHSFHGSESPNKKTQSITSNNDPLIVSDRLIKKQPGVVPVTEEVLSQKLKAKKSSVEVKKKGPLKAIIPLQNMTRGLLKGFKKKDSPKQHSAKVVQNGAAERKKKGNQKRYSSPVPVASSTPNKHIPFNEPSPASSPVLSIKKNISHYSLNSSEELQKSTLQHVKKRSSSLSNFSCDKENMIINRTKSSSSVSDLKKKNSKLSQLPRIKPVLALNSRSGNRSSYFQPSVIGSTDKLPS